jgi:hypothetical protein
MRINNMTYGGHIENGVVVFDQPVGLPEGTQVRVEPLPPVGQRESPSHDDFWQNRTLDEVAAEQGVKPVTDLDETLGGWPEDELDDGFDHAVASWRDAELEQSP